MRCSVAVRVAPITRDDSLDGGPTNASIFPCRARRRVKHSPLGLN